MIQNLIDSIKINLEKTTKEFAAKDILDWPVPQNASLSQLPIIAIYPGKLTFNQNGRDLSEGRPRLHKGRQTIDVEPSQPNKEYPLNNQPLEGTVKAQLLADTGTEDGRSLTPIKAGDFSVEAHQRTIILKNTVVYPGKVYLNYSFVGVRTHTEFQQELHFDFYETGIVKAERLNALAVGVILSNCNDLIETGNKEAKNRYPAGPISVIPEIEAVEIMQAIPEIKENLCKLHLTLQVSGTLRIIREITDNPDIIKSIAAPATAPGKGIKIRIQKNHDATWTRIYSEEKTTKPAEISPKATKKPRRSTKKSSRKKKK